MQDQFNRDMDSFLEDCGVISEVGIGMPSEYVRKRMSVPTLPPSPEWARQDYMVTYHLIERIHEQMIEQNESSGTVLLSEEMTYYLQARPHVFNVALLKIFGDAGTELELDFWQGAFRYQKPSVSKKHTR